MTLDQIIDSTIQGQISINLLRWAAGQQISCPLCGQILDWPTTVIVSGGGRSFVLCDKCFAKHANAILAKHPEVDAMEWLQSLDLDSAHNWHAVDGRIERGARVLREY